MDWNHLISEITALLMALFTAGGIGYAVFQKILKKPDEKEEENPDYSPTELKDAEVSHHIKASLMDMVDAQKGVLRSTVKQFDDLREQIVETYEKRMATQEEANCVRFGLLEDRVRVMNEQLVNNGKVIKTQQEKLKGQEDRIADLVRVAERDKMWPGYIEELYDHIHTRKGPPPPFPPDGLYPKLLDESGLWVGKRPPSG